MNGYSLEPAEGMRQGAARQGVAPGIKRLAVSEYPTAPGAPKHKRSRAGDRFPGPDFGQHLTPSACAHIWLLTCRASQIAEKRALTRIKPRAAGLLPRRGRPAAGRKCQLNAHGKRDDFPTIPVYR